MIELHDVSLCYATRTLLRCGSLHVERGTPLCIFGDSGSGKSSLLNALHGSLPFQPDLFHAGQDKAGSKARVGLINLLTMRAAQRRSLRLQSGYIFQDLKLLNTASVYENILLPLEVRGTKAELARQRVHAIAEKMGLDNLLQSPVAELSTSEKQRVAICRALVADPPLILADEPVSSLDASHAARVFTLLHEACIHGSTLVLTSRNPHMAQHIPGARHIFLNAGWIGKEEHIGGEPK